MRTRVSRNGRHAVIHLNVRAQRKCTLGHLMRPAKFYPISTQNVQTLFNNIEWNDLMMYCVYVELLVEETDYIDSKTQSTHAREYTPQTHTFPHLIICKISIKLNSIIIIYIRLFGLFRRYKKILHSLEKYSTRLRLVQYFLARAIFSLYTIVLLFETKKNENYMQKECSKKHD